MCVNGTDVNFVNMCVLRIVSHRNNSKYFVENIFLSHAGPDMSTSSLGSILGKVLWLLPSIRKIIFISKRLKMRLISKMDMAADEI